MEIGLGVLASLMGLGYAANKNGVQRQKSVTGNISVPPERIPTGTNIYNSKKTVDIWNQEQQMMNNMYKDAKNPNQNIIIPGPPLPEYNKVDYQDDQLPLTFKEKPSEPEFMNGYRERSEQHADPNTSGKKEVNDKFSGMINAFSYGAPPHGGIAPGIDRIVMLLAEQENIREITLFPMNQNAQDLMMQAPSEVDDKQLKELYIKKDIKKN